MAYNFNRGVQIIGDLSGSDDADRNTGIDFEENIIKFVADNNPTFIITGSLVGIGESEPQATLHVSGGSNGVAAAFIGDVYITGSLAKLVIEETTGTDYRVVIDPNNGPLIGFGNDGADRAYMTIGAYNSLNNIDTESRDFHLYGNSTTAGLYLDESLGRFGIGTTSPDYTLDISGNVGVDEYIHHNDDTDTYIQFSNDEIVLYAGGRGFIKCQENDSTDKLMVNYGGLDIDLQVKGENDTNLIRTDAANDRVGIGIAEPVSTFEFSGSLGAPAIHTFTAGTNTADETCFTILLDATAGHARALLPAASDVPGRLYNFKRIDSSANHAMIAPDGSDEIDGNNSDLELTNQYQAYTLQSDGSSWWIIADRNV